MTAIALTESEHAELLVHAQTADPPRRGRIVGAPRTVAEVEARVAASYDRAADGTTVPPGWSVSATYARDEKTGEVDVSEAVAAKIVARPGCSVELKAKLQAVAVLAEP